jgi:hypothetical protein
MELLLYKKPVNPAQLDTHWRLHVMTPEEILGRRITIGIALFVGIPPLLVRFRQEVCKRTQAAASSVSSVTLTPFAYFTPL